MGAGPGCLQVCGMGALCAGWVPAWCTVYMYICGPVVQFVSRVHSVQIGKQCAGPGAHCVGWVQDGCGQVHSVRTRYGLGG